MRATELQPGDCIGTISSEDRVERLDTVSCDKRHDGEVFGVVPLLPLPSYPGEDEVRRHRSECVPLLQKYAPSVAASDTFHYYYLYPTEQTWENGDHSLTCIARFPGGRTGSIKE
ncbi:septum formation family protein [uncultured Mycobacterium sp.]|uniref:septum formation family protein n=1 Tax=uncultured Mycobacterium sp. TaxID=171292 RepID=UPI0035CB8D0E